MDMHWANTIPHVLSAVETQVVQLPLIMNIRAAKAAMIKWLRWGSLPAASMQRIKAESPPRRYDIAWEGTLPIRSIAKMTSVVPANSEDAAAKIAP